MIVQQNIYKTFRIALCFCIITSIPTPANALLEDALDVFHIVKEVTVFVLKTWDIVRESPTINNMNIPLMREKQQKVLSRLKDISKQIIQIENQNSEQLAMAIDSMNNFVENNLQLMHTRNEIQDIMNRIRSRFQQMKTYELYRDKLEESTLLAFAQWTVSPNAYSVQNLMDRLFLQIFNSEENGHNKKIYSTYYSKAMSRRMLTTMLILLFILLNNNLKNVFGRESGDGAMPLPLIQVDSIREQYIRLEKSLWQQLSSVMENQRSVDEQVGNIINKHVEFINSHMTSSWSNGDYEVMNHYEWSLLERNLQIIENMFEVFKQFLNEHRNSTINVEKEDQNFRILCDNIIRNDRTFSMQRIFEDIELIMVKQALYYRAMMASKEERCINQQSTQQFLYSLYTDIALTELKGYTMMEFSWMVLRLYGKGNFSQEAELMRADYYQRTEKTVRLLREVMNRADRLVWRCDPNKYISGKNYEEITRLIQGYVENEVDMNRDEECWQTCDNIERSKSLSCFKDKFCARQERCTGNIHNCHFVASDMSVCQADRKSARRYEYISYKDGVTYGQASACTRGTTKVDSWWRYLFWHCSYCFCYCDDVHSPKTDRYFNLREVTSNVMENKVVTGLRFTKQNRVFHLQIQEGELLPRGLVNRTTLNWKPVDNYTLHQKAIHNKRDYYTLTYATRSIDLDDIYTDDISFVVTGIRFRVVGAHLNLEARFTEFNFENGKLVRPEENSFWKSNDNTDVSGDRRARITLNDPDLPTRTKAKSVPDSRHNQYIEFTASSLRKDAAQSTVPFIDIQDVVSNPPVPLAGVGIYHKGRPGYGGFLAPKIMTYDFTPHIQQPRGI